VSLQAKAKGNLLY